MSSELQERLFALAKSRRYREIAIELVRLEGARGIVSIDDLGQDPEGALEDNPEVTIEYDTSPHAGCSVFGYYRYRTGEPANIIVHPSLTAERDNFTIVHEYGHHVQLQHKAWANVRHSFSRVVGAQLEERVADAFAAEVLIPHESFQYNVNWIDARTLSDLYGRVRASRAAVAMRAVEIAPQGEQSSVVVVDRDGIVTFSRSCGDDVFSPSRGRVQPALARLVSEAINGDGFASGYLAEGLQAASGWAQQDLSAEVAMDHSYGYAFVVVRPPRGFGVTQTWERVERECPNMACEEVFVVDQTVTRCNECRSPQCPSCNSCDCLPKTAATCNKCFFELSLAEQSGAEAHECNF